MPPVNTPSGNQTASDPFSQLASPVPDLASTLGPQNDDDIPTDREENERDLYPSNPRPEALRSPREGTQRPTDSPRVYFDESVGRLRVAGIRMSEDLARLRAMDRSQRDEERLETTDQAEFIREQLRSIRGSSTYQGWAPGTTENDIERLSATPSPVRYFREHARDTATRRHRREQELGRAAQSGSRSSDYEDGMEWQTSDEAESGNLTPGGIFTSSNSLRTAALLQSVRRQARFSLEQEIQSRDPERQREAYYQLHRLLMQDRAHQQARRAGTSNPQRSRRNEEPSPDSEATKWLEEVIKYLERLRSCDSHSDRISSAAAGGFLQGGFFTTNRDDFILDTKVISRPKPTSWLLPGGIFSGSQHASGASPVPSFHMPSRRNTTSSNRAASSQSSSNPSSLHPLRSSWISNVISRTSTEKTDDSWPVKVTVTSIDYETMTMTGTMEAFNVPNKTSSVQETSITTYLEGEIIDFNQYTLETKSFNADSEVDSTYWRKLEPFKSLSDNEVVSNLVSLKWLSEELGQKWILMRWKEKCFVTPSDAQSGLTISGFYYVSMRREDGHIEGLYYDPLSSPYQHLSLMPEKREFPSYSFA